MELRLDFKNLPTRRNTDEIELLSPRETPSNFNRKSLNGSNSARTSVDPQLPGVAGEKIPFTARQVEPDRREGTSIKEMKSSRTKHKKAAFQLKTVVVFPSKEPSSEASVLLPQITAVQAERKAEKIPVVKVAKVVKQVVPMHELSGVPSVDSQASLLDFKLASFPQRPALKKQDTSVVPDHILLQRIRTKKPDIVFNDSPVKGDLQPSSPSTNTRANTGHGSERIRSPGSAFNESFLDSDMFLFSAPPEHARTPSPSKQRANPVLIISPYPSPTAVSPRNIDPITSHAVFGSGDKLKVAGFNITSTPADRALGSSRKEQGSISSGVDDHGGADFDIGSAQSSKVLKVSIPRAMKNPDRERDGDHKQYIAELASELRRVSISPVKAVAEVHIPNPERSTNIATSPQAKTSPEVSPRKPVGGQASTTKVVGVHNVVYPVQGNTDPVAFGAHSLADDYLMQMRFHNNFKQDKEKDALRGSNKPVRAADAVPAQQVSYKQQELVLPSMPIKPKPQQSFMSSAARRHLSLKSGSQKFASARNKSPNASTKNSAASPESDSVESMLKRRAVNDSLSGTRTGVTKGGLFQGEAVDFYDLLNGSASVSASTELSRRAQMARELELEREKILAADTAAAEHSASMDPAVRAAIQAAQSVHAQQSLLPHALSPFSVLERHADLLTTQEQEEVLTFQKVYFVGRSKDLKPQGAAELELNGGYDNTGGHYLALIGDHIRFRYEVLGTLGKGSFGDVFRCRDHKSGIDVAVKVIKNQPIFTAQAEKELAVLNLLKNPDMETRTVAEMSSPEAKAVDSAADRRHYHHMIQLVDSFDFRHHKCFVFPICGMNLYEYLKAKDFSGLPISFVRKVAVQLLDALTHLRSLNVIHCDIKPENILIRNEQSASVVLIDFGSSCIAGQSSFTYIQSRFYRSPEVLLGLPYGFEIDLWSVVCILPELRTAYPAFPGESAADQIACITEVLGYPPEDMYQRCPRKEKYFDDSGVLIVENSPRGQVRTPCSRSVETITSARRKDAQFVDFVAGCLKWLPEERLTLEQCAAHPWLSEGHRAEEEMVVEDVFSPVVRGRADTAGEVLMAAHAPLLDAPVPMAGLDDADLIQKINENADRAKKESAELTKV